MAPRLYQNEFCVNYAKRIGGVGYRVFLVFVPLLNIENFTITVCLLEEYVLNMLSSLNIEPILNTFNTHVMYDQDEVDRTQGTKVKYFVVHFQFFCPMHAMVDTISIDTILQMHQTVVQLYNFLEVINAFYVRLDVFDYVENSADATLFHQDHVCQCNVLLVKVSIPTSEIRRRRSPVSRTSPFGDEELEVEYQDLIAMHSCPIVILNESFYNIARYSWGLSIQNYFLNRSEYVVGCDESSDEVCICKDTLDLITAHNQSNAASRVCFSFSMVLLVLIVRNLGFCEIQRN